MSLLTVVATLALTAGASGHGNYPRPDLLIEAAELAKPDVAKRFVVLDARPKRKYLAGHIPSAAWVDHATWSREFGSGDNQEAWAKRIGLLGIDLETPVVVYEDSTAKDAARIWWILRYWGVKDVRLLNGGWQTWQAAGGKVSPGEVLPKPTQPKLAPHPDRLATRDQLLGWVKAKDHQVVDARSADEYCGTEALAKRGGSIPGAVNLEWVQVIDQKTKRFKGPEELSKLLRGAGIKTDRPAVTYCQSGGRAAVMAFTLELMGAKDVRNYYRSWAEWGNADETPVAKPKANK